MRAVWLLRLVQGKPQAGAVKDKGISSLDLQARTHGGRESGFPLRLYAIQGVVEMYVHTLNGRVPVSAGGVYAMQ